MAIDHGQYPSGHSKKISIMATFAKALKVNQNVANICLTLHIVIALLQNRIISQTELIGKHSIFLHKYLSSNCTRDAEVTVPHILNSLGLVQKVCIVIIQ